MFSMTTNSLRLRLRVFILTFKPKLSFQTCKPRKASRRLRKMFTTIRKLHSLIKEQSSGVRPRHQIRAVCVPRAPGARCGQENIRRGHHQRSAQSKVTHAEARPSDAYARHAVWSSWRLVLWFCHTKLIRSYKNIINNIFCCVYSKKYTAVCFVTK